MKNLLKITIAASTGVIVGCAIGLLYAPKKGKKTRKDLSKKSKKFLRKINAQLNNERLAELKDDFDSQLDKIHEKIKDYSTIN